MRIFRAVFAESGLCRNEPRNADQVIGDEIEDEIGADPKNAAMLGLAHCAIFFAPAEDAPDHLASRLRHAVARVPCGAGVDGAAARLAGLGRALIGGIIGFVLADSDAPAFASAWP